MDEEQAALAQVGKTVGEKYRLLRVLGVGGMGAVYEAEHLFTKRRVALKRMHAGIARGKHAAERFIREAQAPSAIGHPGIVQVLDGGVDADGALYLVLELLDGVSMNDAMEENVLEASAVTQIGIELLEALDAAHAKGFIHRDIKPDNVFLANDGRGGVSVKLLDFGIASLRTNDGEAKLTKTGSILGTPLYMSPEQAQGARVDARSDLWSVGAMLYRALAGKAPYDGDSYNALIVSIVTQPHAPLSDSRPDLPNELLGVVERALRKAPADRFDSAAQMRAALQTVQFRANADEGLPPLASLRPRLDEAYAGSAKSGLRSVQRDISTKPAAATRAGRRVRPKLEPEAAARIVEPASSAAAEPKASRALTVEAEPAVDREQQHELGLAIALDASARRRARFGALTLALGVGLCLVTGFAIFGLRGRPVSGHVASAQLAASDPDPTSAALPPPPSVARATNDPPTAAKRETRVESAPPQAKAASAPASPPREEAKPASRARAPEGLSDDALARVLAGQQPELQRCLQESVVAQMLAGARQAGPFRLDVSLQIAPSGRVESAEVRGQAPDDLVSCVRTRMLAAQFDRAEAPTLFRYPLVLAPTVVGP